VGSDDSHTTGKVKTEPRPGGAFFHSPRSFISASSSPGEPIALIRIALCERNEERSSPSAPLTRRAGLFFCVASRPGGVDLIHGIPGHLGGTDARPEPTRPPVKCAFCDRHHIASAMAELSSYLWIVPHMRSFYVPPKYSAPLTRGLFCDLDFLRGENEKAPARRCAPTRRFGPRRVGTCHDQGGALIMTKTMLVEAVTRRSAVQKVTGAFGQKSAFL
jgi:hypothetical protein